MESRTPTRFTCLRVWGAHQWGPTRRQDGSSPVGTFAAIWHVSYGQVCNYSRGRKVGKEKKKKNNTRKKKKKKLFLSRFFCVCELVGVADSTCHLLFNSVKGDSIILADN
jgi:hypothetical protein